MKNEIIILCFFIITMLFLGCGDNHAKLPTSKDPLTVFKGEMLNILCWEGYADEVFTKPFEAKYGCKIKGTYFGNEDEMISKMQADGGSGAYDIISPSCDFAGYLIKANLVEPLDTSKISQWDKLSAKLRGMADVRKDGNVYGLPFTWGPDYLIYNADLIKEAPTSWRVLWDPSNRGKVSMPDDIVNIYTVGLVLGMATNDKSQLYNMSEAQLQACKTELAALQVNVRKYWTSAGELSNLFKNKEVSIALGWPLTVNSLQKEGMNIKALIPKEGATGWIDRLMIVKGSKHKELANLWFDYISRPENMAKVAEVTTYAVANPDAATYMTEVSRQNTYVGNENYYFERLNWWQWAPNRKRYNEIWHEVRAEAH